MTTQTDRRFDFSGGIKTSTTWLLRGLNEVEDAINGRFDKIIGAIVRRDGYEQEGDTLQSGKRGLGLHESKFSAGAKVLAAINNSGDTETVIKIYNNGAGTWSNMTLPAAVDRDTKMQFIDAIGETYVAGLSTNTNARMTLLNIKDASTVSSTRNLIGAPKARFIAEYGGRLYALNVKVGSTVFNDRAYRSSPPMGVITFVQGAQDVFSTLRVDSVRYLKSGMAVDLYTAGTETKTQDISITAVDKAANTITYSASTATTFATGDVNTSTEVITIGRNLSTGTPVKTTSSGSVPAGLTSGTIYYAINVSSTTIKLATTRDNATAGTAIDITSTGSGTHTITSGIHIPDNDEIWLDGRKGELSYVWNTDYPTEQDADFIRVEPGTDADSEITAWNKSNNRLFIFTKNSMRKFDSANMVTVFEDIGCSNHETIQNIGDWMIWMDSEGRIHARNDATGQYEPISRAIQNTLLADVPTANLATAAAGRIGSIYKLCLGTVNSKVLRVCYDFDSNTWAHEEHLLSMTNHMRSDLDGPMKLYFLSDTGKLFEDETGNTDDGATIPFSVTFGRTHNGTEQLKNYQGVGVYTAYASGASVKACTDGSPDWLDNGQIKGEFSKISLSTGQRQMHGRDLNIKASINTEGKAPWVYGLIYYFNLVEDKFGQPT